MNQPYTHIILPSQPCHTIIVASGWATHIVGAAYGRKTQNHIYYITMLYYYFDIRRIHNIYNIVITIIINNNIIYHVTLIVRHYFSIFISSTLILAVSKSFSFLKEARHMVRKGLVVCLFVCLLFWHINIITIICCYTPVHTLFYHTPRRFQSSLRKPEEETCME